MDVHLYVDTWVPPKALHLPITQSLDLMIIFSLPEHLDSVVNNLGPPLEANVHDLDVMLGIFDTPHYPSLRPTPAPNLLIPWSHAIFPIRFGDLPLVTYRPRRGIWPHDIDIRVCLLLFVVLNMSLHMRRRARTMPLPTRPPDRGTFLPLSLLWYDEFSIVLYDTHHSYHVCTFPYERGRSYIGYYIIIFTFITYIYMESKILLFILIYDLT